MIRYEYESQGRLVRHLYFLDELDIGSFEDEIASCDELAIFYTKKMSRAIESKYGQALIYMSKGSNWNTPNHSIMIDLTKSGQEILNGFHKNRRYKVRRALEKDHFVTNIFLNPVIDKLKEAGCFYDYFAREKGMPNFDIERYAAACRAGCFMLASIRDEDGDLLVQNGYLLDDDHKISTFAFGASHFRTDTGKAALIGRANGCLHYKVMLYLKEMGYMGFDFGGLYIGDDEGLTNISNFKRGFGGEIRTYSPKIIFQKKDYENVEHNIVAIKRVAAGKNIIIWGMGTWGKYVASRIYEVYGTKPGCLIDSCISDDPDIQKPDILSRYSPHDSYLIVATRRVQYEEIIKNKMVQSFTESNSILCIREELL